MPTRTGVDPCASPTSVWYVAPPVKSSCGTASWWTTGIIPLQNRVTAKSCPRRTKRVKHQNALVRPARSERVSPPCSAHHADTMRASLICGLEIPASEATERIDGQRIIADQFRESVPAKRRYARMAGRGQHRAQYYKVGRQRRCVLELTGVVAGSANQRQRRARPQTKKLSGGEVHAVGAGAPCELGITIEKYARAVSTCGCYRFHGQPHELVRRQMLLPDLQQHEASGKRVVEPAQEFVSPDIRGIADTIDRRQDERPQDRIIGG